MTLRFLLVCEGSSDAALLTHISKLLIQIGRFDPQGSAWTRGVQLVDKIRNGLQHSSSCDLLLIHRDADSGEETRSAGLTRRTEEIASAVSDSGFIGPWVAIVPVRMTEAWLLLDETAIRQVAGRPNGKLPLGLPPHNQVENESNPKACLEQALMAASETSGRRRQRFNRDIPHMRRLLLDQLPVGGPLEHIPSWVRFRDGLAEALATVETV